MHELTLLFGVADRVGEVCRENDIDHVDAVVLEIGEATAIVPEFMYDGYSVISDEFDFLRGSQLFIDVVRAVGRCRSCGTEFGIADNEGICPECGNRSYDIIQGRDFFIKEVRLLES